MAECFKGSEMGQHTLNPHFLVFPKTRINIYLIRPGVLEFRRRTVLGQQSGWRKAVIAETLFLHSTLLG